MYLLRTRAAVDKEFYVRLICCVNDILYQWLKDCCRVSCANEITTILTDFGGIFQDIQMNQFYYLLPPKVTKQKRRKDEGTDEKGKRFKTEQNSKRIVNPRVVPNWKLRQNETWDTIFRGQSRAGPELLSGCKPCLKYHVKGFCYDDCKFSKNHEEIKEQDREKTENFIKSLRGE